MNETGRLLPFAMFHIDMKIRLTLTSEPRVAVTDAAGMVMGIEFDDREPKRHQEATTNGELSIVRLLYMPKALYVKLEEVEGASDSTPTEWISPRACNQHAVEGADAACKECSFFKNCVVVPAVTNLRPWSIDIVTKEVGEVSVKVKRTQLPVVCITASTLHVLQGTTCDPGLIFHWTLPNRLSPDQRWLAVYVALSRVRNLKSLRSIGMDKKVKKSLKQVRQRTCCCSSRHISETRRRRL